MSSAPFDWSVGRDSILLAATRLNGRPVECDCGLTTDVTGLVEIGLEHPDGRMLGPIRTWFDKHADVVEFQPYLCNLTVLPEHRRKGLGKYLCAVAEYVAHVLWAKDSIYLHVRASNAPAIAMYTAVGYRELQRLPDPQGEILYLTKDLR
jgi:ribosomal protein S18 acetylase RimI-like enzyme